LRKTEEQEDDEEEDGKRSVVASNVLQKFVHGWVWQTRCSGSCKNLTKIGFSYRARACVDEGFVGLFVYFWLKISWGSREKKKKKEKEEMSGFGAHGSGLFFFCRRHEFCSRKAGLLGILNLL
jgi:hypothetical protein